MRFKRITPYVLLSPILILYIFLIGGGLIETVKESMGYIPVLGFNTFNLDSYKEIFGQNSFLKDMLYSVYIAVMATILSTFLGIIIAYCFVTSRNSLIKGIVKKILQMGLIIPYLYVVFLAMLMLSQTGLISRLMYNIGVLKDLKSFPELVFDRRGLGIIWVYVFKGTPFIALLVLNVMSKISSTYEDVAKSLNASGLTILRKIYIPLSSGAIIWTSCIVFAYALGSFEVPYLLGSISPVSLSSKLYSLFINPNLSAIPKGMAMNVILIILGGIIIGVYAMLLKILLKGRRS
ncbi:ABC transporter permease [Clostridium sp.]|uniref:ABC transporter permease n=1 Tax=Clostridium sp. TaxID=1506 RepID=UPI001A366B4D|nr:ABC transporter permease subunit [Clostridium sp.]MBK5236610.1 ABC transporter permease subunit [Clostridium sp.]